MENAVLQFEAKCQESDTRLNDIEWKINQIHQYKNSNNISPVELLKESVNLLETLDKLELYNANKVETEEIEEEQLNFRNAFSNYQSQTEQLQKNIEILNQANNCYKGKFLDNFYEP